MNGRMDELIHYYTFAISEAVNSIVLKMERCEEEDELRKKEMKRGS